MNLRYILDRSDTRRDNDAWVDLPDDAEVGISTILRWEKGRKWCQIYDLQKETTYVTLSNIPAVSDITLRLSEKDAKTSSITVLLLNLAGEFL